MASGEWVGRTSARCSPCGVVQDPLDYRIKRQSGLRHCGGKTCVGGQAWIGVDFQNPRLAICIDSKIHTRITLQAEHFPTPPSQRLQFIQQWLVARREGKSSWRVQILGRVFVPLGIMTNDLWLVVGKIRELDFR